MPNALANANDQGHLASLSPVTKYAITNQWMVILSSNFGCSVVSAKCCILEDMVSENFCEQLFFIYSLIINFMSHIATYIHPCLVC